MDLLRVLNKMIVRHGSEKEGDGDRFCGLHRKHVRPGLWHLHGSYCEKELRDKMEKLKKGKGEAKALKAKRKGKHSKRRSSNVTHWCSVHGKFEGYGWGGHRRLCRAKEVSVEEWKKLTRGSLSHLRKTPGPRKGLKEASFKEVFEQVGVDSNGSLSPKELSAGVENYCISLEKRHRVVKERFEMLSTALAKAAGDLQKVEEEKRDFASLIQRVASEIKKTAR